MKRTKDTSNQILEGAIWKQLLLFFFPILLGTFFQQFYNTIDMIIVGRFVGTQALASVGGSAGQIINLVVGFLQGYLLELVSLFHSSTVREIRKC